MRVHLDKIASVTRNLRLGRQVTLTPEIEARPGAVVVGRIHGEKNVYNQLEDVHGRLSVLHEGDVIAGALGHRNALQGYEGLMPKAVAAGDALHLLNTGGVIGQAAGSASRKQSYRDGRAWLSLPPHSSRAFVELQRSSRKQPLPHRSRA